MNPNDRKRWEALNEAGSRLFGVNWIAANECAVSILESCGLPAETNRALGGSIAVHIALAASYGKPPRIGARDVEEKVVRHASGRVTRRTGVPEKPPRPG